MISLIPCLVTVDTRALQALVQTRDKLQYNNYHPDQWDQFVVTCGMYIQYNYADIYHTNRFIGLDYITSSVIDLIG